MRLALGVLFFICIAPAAADLYRWVDPETGSVKYSSYPPPWFNDAARQRGAPKVDVIAPARSAPAFAPEPETEREPVAKSSDRSPSRETLLKQLAQRVAALVSAPPAAMGKASADLAEPLQQLERLDRQLKAADPADEAARQEEKWKIAAPLEARRSALLQQASTLSPPPPGAPREGIENAWLGTQRLLGALELTNRAIDGIDPRQSNARHFEMNALIDKIVVEWEPYVDSSIVRKNRGR